MIIDLTHTITPEMPVYPGTVPPVLESAGTLANRGWRETRLAISSHSGTHMDAPAHILADGSTLPMSRLLDLTYNSDAGQAEAVFQLERITDPEQAVSVTVFGETIPVP